MVLPAAAGGDAAGETLVDKVQAMIDSDPGLSMRKLARMLAAHECLIRKVVNENEDSTSADNYPEEEEA